MRNVGVYSTSANKQSEYDEIETYEVESDEMSEKPAKKVDHHALMSSTRNFPESIYGAAMVGIVRSVGRDHRLHCATPMVFFVLFLNLLVQGYVLYAVKMYVCAPQVIKVQALYSEFEDACRVDGVFSQELFDDWDKEKIANLCQVPLSQPSFFTVILIVWTALIMQDLSESFSLCFYWLKLPAPGGGENLDEDEDENGIVVDNDNAEVYIYKATGWTKALVVIFVLIPKIVIACVLWWLGSRWLTATTSFQDIIINAVALSFITDLDEIVYAALLTTEFKDKVVLYKIWAPHSTLKPKHTNAVMIIVRTVVCVCVPCLYILRFQMVLPEYHWDVAEPCQRVFAKLIDQDGKPMSSIDHILVAAGNSGGHGSGRR